MIVVAPEAANSACPGSRIVVDSYAGTVEVDGTLFEAPMLPTFMLEMIELGGLVAWAQQRLAG